MAELGLSSAEPQHLGGEELSVVIWQGTRAADFRDDSIAVTRRDAA